ncbi:GntR family transcriptional regulator [Pacificibacter marinus]|uniref:GntR family transcriptional regulator n=1 Tax=Pacificibacter marinus TaxID=658057 RepID=UPI001C07EA56|nr:GntR family transcriptional regulator [Pacificibacter marinus]MBU2868080.1 GntR family transcriptional regulator [Pacificibacter marinus]
MQHKLYKDDRQSAADFVFEQLYSDIISLKLLPGAKLSEMEVARNFGVSPQPVRTAFHRLSNNDLLVVRPQRATRVRGFTLEDIQEAQFIRMSVEMEVLYRACDVWDEARNITLLENLEKQKRCVEAVDAEGLEALDYEFHRLICDLAGYPKAFDTIKRQKQKICRLCSLEMQQKKSELRAILTDHLNIAHHLEMRSLDKLLIAARKHFNRLDETIEYLHRVHSEYFDID